MEIENTATREAIMAVLDRWMECADLYENSAQFLFNNLNMLYDLDIFTEYEVRSLILLHYKQIEEEYFQTKGNK